MNERELEDQIRSLYGEVDWTRARGILHVMAIADPADAVIAIGPAAPRSKIDRFVLGFARARCESILTTGSILRAEPMLDHRYADDAETNESFVRWRRKTLGLEETPALLIVSRSGELPEDHPALRFARAGMIWTSKAGREKLGPSAGRLAVEAGIGSSGGSFVEMAAANETAINETATASAMTAASMAGSLGMLLRRARSEFHAQTVLIEAGPKVSSEFYRRPRIGCPRLDELLLSRFEGTLEREAIGPRFEAMAQIGELFPDAPTSRRVEAASGVWSFDRYRACVSDESCDRET